MSIGTFVSSSLELMNEGKYDVALSLACSAVDATSAKCFPNEKSNNARYKSFLIKNMRIVTTYGMPGVSAGGIRIKCINIPDLKTNADHMAGLEDILYHVIRCGLIHQCEIENRIEFTERTMLGDFDGKFRIPFSIIFGLIMAVILSKENSSERMPNIKEFNISGDNIDLNSFWGKGEINA
ncbi:MAG: hypothetical protein HOG49_30205 [Candidatus Scalindua sp.]|jgi:hypothetical protein|nr:hypothetical protein [Candidatus Scalindua sp.]